MTGAVNKQSPFDPPLDCARCPRLVSFRTDNQAAYADYFNGPAPSFGDANAELLILGLAPGLHGANRTGRPFTGDYAGDLLYATLEKFGLTRGRYGGQSEDGLQLVNTMISNAVRCVPPQNKPIAQEIKACQRFLIEQLRTMPNLRMILCLGRIAHNAALAALEIRQKDAPFAHGARHQISDQLVLFDSYHCSRYNTNTRRLTPAMFESVFELLTSSMASPPHGANTAAAL